ncbi:MAG: UMF1 family MFS transporter [Cellvibrionaceae bacterium]|jgi:UMF1 family MFS transporter
MSALETLNEKIYNQRKRSWAMYDWANSAFILTIVTAVLPIYYSDVAGANLPSQATATQYWSLTLSVSVLIVALLSPILGAVSDILRGKKKFLAAFTGLGVIGSALLYFVQSGDWLMASIFFIIGRVGFGSANVFYDALLPHVAREEDQDRVSTTGYVLGYLGSGLLLIANIAMIQILPGTLGVRLSFLSVAVWWLIFAFPLFRNVPEPPSASEELKEGESLIKTGFTRMIATIREIRDFKDLFTFLIGFLIYNDGINIIIGVAAIYGRELGFPSSQLILAILLVQFAGIPYTMIFGNLPAKENKWQTRFLAFVIFNILALPVVGVAGKFFLPNEISGRPPAPFVASGEFLGEGSHSIAEVGNQSGPWSTEPVSGALRGQSCSWLAFGCDESQFNVAYAVSDSPNSRIEIPFNGQPINLTHSIGPDHGVWAVEIDGQPLLSEDGNAVEIDAYNATVRYDVKKSYQAEAEGEHTLSIVNTGRSAADSSGAVMSLGNFEVLAPLRSSNLGIILGILLGVQIVGVLFALATAPLFTGLASRINTKEAIILALVAYAIIAVWGFFLNAVIEFWYLAWMVSVVQGGSQALSRSLYASLSPTSRSGEFFGFFSIMSKFASFLAPLVFVASVAIFDSSRPGVLSLIFFFTIGMYLLMQVDVDRGVALAKAKDAEYLSA